MRKALLIVVLLSLGLLLLMGGGIDCAEEEAEELLAPEIEFVEVVREKVIAVEDLANQLAATELAFRISNPNDFEISVNTMLLELYIGDVQIECPNLAERVYVPGQTSVIVRKMFVLMPMDVIGNLMASGGKTFMEAMATVATVWESVTAGTATWEVDCRANISSEIGDLSELYQLSWTMPAQ